MKKRKNRKERGNLGVESSEYENIEAEGSGEKESRCVVCLALNDAVKLVVVGVMYEVMYLSTYL